MLVSQINGEVEGSLNTPHLEKSKFFSSVGEEKEALLLGRY